MRSRRHWHRLATLPQHWMSFLGFIFYFYGSYCGHQYFDVVHLQTWWITVFFSPGSDSWLPWDISTCSTSCFHPLPTLTTLACLRDLFESVGNHYYQGDSLLYSTVVAISHIFVASISVYFKTVVLYTLYTHLFNYESFCIYLFLYILIVA